ncbi:MAG: tRNA (N6-isopentenyl adenosine(37)-C2)-methylthiotransferase MiaB [Pantoea sp. Brub]|nr:tRNA (N6-isopentenyl adenosine(37)-C2)-methylthiotransferase MiaB [Pantoea sp. Brub]
MNKLYIKTWGCQMNEYDSSKIVDLLNNKLGCVLTEKTEEADILLLNTCSIREKAEVKLFHQLGRWKYLKEKKPNLIIGVGGCVAAQEGDYILNRAKYVDIIFGPQTIHRLPEMIISIHKNNESMIDISFPSLEKFDYFPNPIATGPSAFVSIMEGCNKYCTFCIVPHTRGEEVSRPSDDILLEIFQLSKQGVREITLLGQNVNAYCGYTFDGKICNFADLIRLVASIEGINRIRFITSHPIEFTDDIIEAYSDTPELVNFLHLPVQSGADRILNLMKRAHSISDYKKIISKLRTVRPNIQISSDFIIGFPGETQQDFEQTVKFIADMNFDMSFSFIYSARPGTPAAKLIDHTTEKEKKYRLNVIQKLIKKQAKYWTYKMLGTEQTILVDNLSNKNSTEIFGRTENNRIVAFQGSSNMLGKFVNVKIIDVCNNSLQGKLLYIN